MAGWTPLFAKITTSSIWDESNHVRLAWITMLAHTGKSGVCETTVRGLAAIARLTKEEAEDAVRVLSSPDENSLGKEHEGRRIQAVDGGFLILNWQKYRKQAQSAATKESNRVAQEKFRQKQAVEDPPEEPVDDTEQNESWTGRPLR